MSKMSNFSRGSLSNTRTPETAMAPPIWRAAVCREGEDLYGGRGNRRLLPLRRLTSRLPIPQQRSLLPIRDCGDHSAPSGANLWGGLQAHRVPQPHHGRMEQPTGAVFISMPHRRLLGMGLSRVLTLAR